MQGTSGPSMRCLFHRVTVAQILKRRCHQPLRASRGSSESACDVSTADSAMLDGSNVWWLESPGVIGNRHLTNPDEADPNPDSWVLGSNWDPAFALFDEVLFISGFESGKTCAWSSSATGAVCP